MRIVRLLVFASALVPMAQALGETPVDDIRYCDTKPEGLVELGGGMAGDWDGAGLNAATVFWHIDGTTSDVGSGQRTAFITALQAWASVVQITFDEVPITNRNTSIDFNFLTLDHSATEPQEAGDPDCPFDGPSGVLAHAGFPPGVNSACVNPMANSWAGNVHFDEAETWEQDNASGVGPFSLTLIACHEIGHSIGCIHDNSGGGDVMRPSFSSNDGFLGLSADDIANVRTGYAAGVGQVRTLETLGVWVDAATLLVERGTQANPFDTVIEGVNGVPPFTTSVTVHIQAGNYPENITISKALILQADGGTVTIGS